MQAFSDGVVAILITILVLELRPPHGAHLADILDDKSTFLAYVLTFVFVAIYWNNHHHLLQLVHRLDGKTLWANIHLLFWLSLTPVATAWLGQTGVKQGPVAAYAIVLIGCAVSYTILVFSLIAVHEPGSDLSQAIGEDRKGKISLALYVVAFALSFVAPWVSVALFVTVALIWVIPDRRIERFIVERLAPTSERSVDR